MAEMPSRGAGNGERREACRNCRKLCVINTMGKHLQQKPECLQAYMMDCLPACRPCPVELNPEQSNHYHAEMKSEAFKDTSEWLFFRYMGGPQYESILNAVNRWNILAVNAIAEVLPDLVGDTAKQKLIIQLVTDRLNFFRGLETPEQVERYATQNYPVPKYHMNQVGKELKDRSYNVMMVDWISTMLRYNDKVREKIVSDSEMMKSGAFLKEPTTYDNWKRGSTFRKHAFAQQHVQKPGEPFEIRITVMVGYDEMEPLDALGQQRGEKTLSCFYASCGNLEAEERFKHENMLMLTMSEEPVTKRCSGTRIFAGADPKTGEFIVDDFSSPGAQFRSAFDLSIVTKVSTDSTSPPACVAHTRTQSSAACVLRSQSAQIQVYGSTLD